MAMYSTKRAGGVALRRHAWIGFLGMSLLVASGHAGVGSLGGQGGVFCLPDDLRWTGQLTGCQPGFAWPRAPEGRGMDGSGVEALFQRPGSDSDLFRLGHWSLDVPAATESPGPNAVPPTGAAPPDAWDSAQAVPDPGADDWLSIQLDEDGFYMFLGDVHGVPEEMSAVSEGWEELPSSIGIQKKWHF